MSRRLKQLSYYQKKVDSKKKKISPGIEKDISWWRKWNNQEDIIIPKVYTLDNSFNIYIKQKTDRSARGNRQIPVILRDVNARFLITDKAKRWKLSKDIAEVNNAIN